MLWQFPTTPWRNGNASDSRSEGCVFESRRCQIHFSLFRFLHFTCTITATKHFETSTGFDDLLLKKKTYALILHSGCMPSKLAI